MLQISFLRENQEKVVKGLQKRHFPEAEEAVKTVVEKDQQRRNTQTELDQILASSKTVSKKIGQLMKEGKKDEAEAAKQETSLLKERSKTLGEQLKQYEDELAQLLYNLPNIPNDKVPEGRSAEDNEVNRAMGRSARASRFSKTSLGVD
ncbi:seryl-tRNA synthetase [Catalinimonas alkaloidigena]|nr:seryl-tRNA synthetase [Catalinimonas alkaloidigena]